MRWHRLAPDVLVAIDGPEWLLALGPPGRTVVVGWWGGRLRVLRSNRQSVTH